MTMSVRASRLGITRVLGTLVLGILALGTTTACSDESGAVNCDLNSCTVSMDRNNQDATVSVLGADVSLVSATGNEAVLTVAGQQVTVPVDSSTPVDVGGLGVTVTSITQDAVNVKIGKL
ncbi:MAG: hypothetical protein QG608_740 [Actinomycetota bacterium]|nr:hypothetical protein [Actinomycetota bacterium]